MTALANDDDGEKEAAPAGVAAAPDSNNNVASSGSSGSADEDDKKEEKPKKGCSSSNGGGKEKKVDDDVLAVAAAASVVAAPQESTGGGGNTGKNPTSSSDGDGGIDGCGNVDAEASAASGAVVVDLALQQQQCPRRGLLKAMIERFSSTPLEDPVANSSKLTGISGNAVVVGGKFSSTPLDLTSDDEDDAAAGATEKYGTSSSSRTAATAGRKNRSSNNVLTNSERQYLEGILESGDLPAIEAASQALTDRTIFPEVDDDEDDGNDDKGGEGDEALGGNSNDKKNNVKTKPTRRASRIRQELFRLHETKGVLPSYYRSAMESLQHRNSILDSSSATGGFLDDYDDDKKSPTSGCNNKNPKSFGRSNSLLYASNASMAGEGDDDCDDDDDGVVVDSDDDYDWDGYFSSRDITSWLDGGSEGVEVDDDGVPLGQQKQKNVGGGGDGGSSQPNNAASAMSSLANDVGGGGPSSTAAAAAAANTTVAAARPFRILGTTADDASCQPHVLSPPLMESLLAFVPESLSDSSNFWLKYSLARDGPGLRKMLRQVRASTHCFVAIETTQGHVFGAFTSQAWRLSMGWYGSNESFLWKMRRSRLDPKKGVGSGSSSRRLSLLQQVVQESEIQVYPYRTGNVAVQYCSKECLMMGQGELVLQHDQQQEPAMDVPFGSKSLRDAFSADDDDAINGRNSGEVDEEDKHYGHAIYLQSNLLRGTTSNSETFGNPCLVAPNRRGSEFEVCNLEVWTLTPHDNVAEAERSELSALFLEGGRGNEKSLNFMNILVGGPI